LSQRKEVKLSKTILVGKERAFVSYCEKNLNDSMNNLDNSGNSSWLWMIPQRRILIIAPGSKKPSFAYEKYYEEILNNMTFIPQTGGLEVGPS